MVELPDGEKNFEDMCKRLHRIPAYDGRTDGRTDRRADRILPPHMFLCDILLPSGVTNDDSPRYAYASRGKNVTNFTTVVALDVIYPAVS